MKTTIAKLTATTLLLTLLTRPVAAEISIKATCLPSFKYVGTVIDPADLKYAPCPDSMFPSVIKAYEHFEKPLGRYYMYFGPHNSPGGISLAYADKLEGPWIEYKNNPVIARNWEPHYKVSHVCSADAIWNEEADRLFLYFHGANNTTRYATSKDGIHFEYGGIAMQTKMISQDLTECSYARVARYTPPESDYKYLMTIMGNSRKKHRGIRKVYIAWSKDGRTWDPVTDPLLDPPPGTDQTGSAWLFPWKGRYYMIVLGNLIGKKSASDPLTNLYAYEVDPAMTHGTYRGLVFDRTAVSPTTRRVDSACFVEEDGKIYMFMAAGKRCRQKIGLAITTISEE